jgi:hypothetical protein
MLKSVHTDIKVTVLCTSPWEGSAFSEEGTMGASGVESLRPANCWGWQDAFTLADAAQARRHDVAVEWFKIKNTMPVIDVQISPAGVAFASVTISIINRAERK